MKRFFVDTLSLNIFIVFTAFFVEVVFSGISLDVFWKGRLIMIIPNIITVEPYNKTRNFVGRKLGTWNHAQLHQIFRDTIVFVLYRVPLVFVVLLILDAPREKIITSCIVATLVSGFTGRPYGIFLDWMRKTFKT